MEEVLADLMSVPLGDDLMRKLRRKIKIKNHESIQKTEIENENPNPRSFTMVSSSRERDRDEIPPTETNTAKETLTGSRFFWFFSHFLGTCNARATLNRFRLPVH